MCLRQLPRGAEYVEGSEDQRAEAKTPSPEISIPVFKLQLRHIRCAVRLLNGRRGGSVGGGKECVSTNPYIVRLVDVEWAARAGSGGRASLYVP